jgi:hypothetical protein
MRKCFFLIVFVLLASLLVSPSFAQNCVFKTKNDESLKQALQNYHEALRAVVHGPADKGDFTQVRDRAQELSRLGKAILSASLPEKLAARCAEISAQATALAGASDNLALLSANKAEDKAVKEALDRAHKAYQQLNRATTTLDDLLNAFHDLMHPLWHDAYPKKDANAIKAQIPRMKVRAKLILSTAEASDKAKAGGAKGLLDAVTTLEEAAAAKDDVAVLEALRIAHDAYEKLAGGH